MGFVSPFCCEKISPLAQSCTQTVWSLSSPTLARKWPSWENASAATPRWWPVSFFTSFCVAASHT